MTKRQAERGHYNPSSCFPLRGLFLRRTLALFLDFGLCTSDHGATLHPVRTKLQMLSNSAGIVFWRTSDPRVSHALACLSPVFSHQNIPRKPLQPLVVQTSLSTVFAYEKVILFPSKTSNVWSPSIGRYPPAASLPRARFTSYGGHFFQIKYLFTMRSFLSKKNEGSTSLACGM